MNINEASKIHIPEKYAQGIKVYITPVHSQEKIRTGFYNLYLLKP